MKRRMDRMIEERFHDPYYEGKKYPEPTICEECGAVFEGGRWTWKELKSREGVETSLCPACRRIRDRYPAGVVVLDGEFIKDPSKREEILNLVRNVEEKAKGLHPLERIMEIKEEGNTIEVYTTDPHLARRIGEAVNRAYKGEFEMVYPEEERFVRVYWRRD